MGLCESGKEPAKIFMKNAKTEPDELRGGQR